MHNARNRTGAGASIVAALGGPALAVLLGGSSSAAALTHTGGAGPNSAPAFPLAYGPQSACINRNRFTNNVLPANSGEFGTHGLDTAYWGAPHSRTEPPTATWPGYQTSWGAFQYNTYFGNPNDGSGYSIRGPRRRPVTTTRATMITAC